jgi:hypothetical protein
MSDFFMMFRKESKKITTQPPEAHTSHATALAAWTVAVVTWRLHKLGQQTQKVQPTSQHTRKRKQK